MIARVVVALALVVGLAAPARAETRRVAVIVGNNIGNQPAQALRYAEVDAAKVGRVLVELGGVAQGDLFLLQGQDLATLDATLRRAKAQIAAYKSRLDRVVVIFYYSGHSDGVALELGRDRYAFADLRRWLKDTGADVRLGLVDSCKSGALLAMKGGTLGPAFHIRLTDELSSTGEALLTSSAADENALESREIGGSFFTHHLVSGLRGAADASGDAKVTLTEAYQYAYKHTISTSAATLAGPQHPAYDYRLSGQGELILTELARPTAALVLPDGFDRALVIELARAQVIAELDRGDPRQVAVVPGRYRVRAWRGGVPVEATLAIGSGTRALRWDELGSTTVVATRAKGDGIGEVIVRAAPEPPGQLAVFVGGGGRASIAEPLSVLGGVRAGVRSTRRRTPTFALDATTRGAGALRETSVFAYAGYRVAVDTAGVRLSAGLELGGGLVRQTLDRTASSGALAIAPTAAIAVPITPRVAIELAGQLPETWIKLDGDYELVALPSAWLGVIVTP
ncbi:MAG TPA: caspase family protein [Kofleriaceae bacterium]|nr:caspase family protein [Kofleriaceae bacterium]